MAGTLSLQRVMAPIHQRVAPLGVLLVAGRPALGEMAMRVAHDLAHVRVVVLVELVLVLALDRHDPPAGLVADRLALAPADGLRLLGLEPALELLGAHVDHRVELVADVVLVAHDRRLSALGLCTASPPPFSLRTRYCGSSGDALTLRPAAVVSEVILRSTTPGVSSLPCELHTTLSPFLNSSVITTATHVRRAV